MKDEIKEIFDIWADDDGEIVVHYIDKNNNKQEYKMITRDNLLDYIADLQEENKRLSIELNKNMIERNNYLSRNEKAIEHIEESLYILKGDGDILIATSNVRNIYIKPLLNILKGSDKE